MGAECKGAPLPLDIGQCMKYASEEVYCLEITGTKSKSYLWDQNAEEKQETYSTEGIKAEIQKYEGLLKTHGNSLPDKGEKLKNKLRQLYEMLEEQQKQEMTNHYTVEQGKGSAFNEPIGILRGASSNGNRKMRITKGSDNGNTCRGQKSKSSFMVSSLSFYTTSRDFSQELNLDLEDSKLTQVESSIASRVASGKRYKTPSPLQKAKTPLLKNTSAGFVKGLKKDTIHESASSKKSRLFPELHVLKDSPGASLDTAMELSDDEEKRGTQDAKADFNRKDPSSHPYSLRSNLERRGGLKVTYPSGDPEAVEVQESDMKHLDPYEFLNDTVIDFYIKYLQRPEFLSQEKKVHFHFFNTFFFKKLLLEKRKRRRVSTNYSKLRKWTKGVNIFEKKYLLVPVHDCAHWSLAIICFATNHQERNGLTPYVLHLDSMREGHLSDEVFHVLSRYLEAEWNHIRGLDVNDESCTTVLKDFVCRRVEVPLQQNAWDCGLFLLYFIECFLRDADDIFEPRSLDSMFGRQWFKPHEASSLRKRIRSVLENLMQELNDEIMMEDMD